MTEVKFTQFTSCADPATGSLGSVTGLRPFRGPIDCSLLVMEMFGDRKYCQETALQDSLFTVLADIAVRWEISSMSAVL